MKKISINLFLFYLRTMARVQLYKIKPLIIGVGGSSGKSSLSDLIEIVLAQKYIVKNSHGKNSETGIPLNVLDIDVVDYSLTSWLRTGFLAFVKIFTNWKKYDVYVLEMGIDSPNPPKNMDYLLKFIKPNIGILTSIGLEHAQFFEDYIKHSDNESAYADVMSAIASEELLLLKSIKKSGRNILNIDNEYIKKSLPLVSKSVSISRFEREADFYITKISISENSFVVNFNFLNEEYEIKLNKPLPYYFAYSLLFALACAFSCEININSSIKLLEEKFKLPPGRFSVFDGIKNSIIIDSSYNSSPEACIGALNSLKDFTNRKRKVGILGDMRELGRLSKFAHEELALVISKTLNFSILIGPNMCDYVAPILNKKNCKYIAFDSFKDVKESLPDLINEKDLIIIKGSQNNLYLERAVELLLKNKNDRENLCRRGKYWDKIRQKSN